MAGTKKRNPTVQTVLRWIRAGYGQGEGSGFKPFMYVRDVPSEGTSSMVQSRITGRTHHYLSWVEFSVHLLAEYCRSIVDIREQYALLPWEETQETAAKLGIKHPVIPSTDTPSVVTTDLLLSLKEPDGVRLVAVSVKLEKDLTPRTLEKLLLERMYWNRRGITWVLATDKNVPGIRTGNLRFFENSIRNQDALCSGVDPETFSRRFEQEWAPKRPYIDILRAACTEFNVDSNVGHGILGAAVWQRKTRLNIDHAPIEHKSYVALIE